MKLLITGGREFHDVEFIVYQLNQTHARKPVTTLISGMATGVDTYCALWAEEMGIPVDPYPAKWAELGNDAGIIRNGEMLAKSNADMIMAFPGGAGTKDMWERAKDVPWLDHWQSKEIAFRKEDPDYGFLSNFAKGFEFVDEDGCIWSTSEHHYQAQKTLTETDRARIQMAPSPFKAKELGGSIICRPGWNGFRIKAMRKTLELKFKTDSEAAERLVATHPHYLIEDTPWGDKFWGKTYGVGENRLGKLLMERRESLILDTHVVIWE